jgi:1-aminocyclopropane-1-carboxylate deaminase
MQGQSSDIPLQQIKDKITLKYNVDLYVLRLDLNHSFISGNKLFKLKYNLEQAKRSHKNTLLTFGGAYSNHIAATAAAGKEYGFKTVGIIRGEATSVLNPTLKFAREQGMELHFASREKYRQKEDPAFIDLMFPEYSDSYIIPEGGANILGIEGCKEIPGLIKIPFDTIACPCGTGTTLTGIILGLKENQKALGFQVLKGENYIRNEVESWLNKFSVPANDNWKINENYHFDGYAKRSPELISFVDDFENENDILLDYIYTGKMMYGIYDLIKKGFFEKGKTIIAVHTGGLQGNKGFDKLSV